MRDRAVPQPPPRRPLSAWQSMFGGSCYLLTPAERSLPIAKLYRKAKCWIATTADGVDHVLDESLALDDALMRAEDLARDALMTIATTLGGPQGLTEEDRAAHARWQSESMTRGW